MSAARPFLGMVRPIIGVVHLRALPGAPAHRGGMTRVLDRARSDAHSLAAAGCDALLVENHGDAPFWKDQVPPETVAALTAAALAIRETAPDVPIGVNCLRNDARAALGVAAAVGAAFVRVNVLTGAVLTDQGVIEGRAAELARARRAVAPRVWVAADVLVKHATPLAPVDPAVVARDTAERGGADALIVTGVRTGAPVDLEELRIVRAAAGRTPVLIGSGVTARTVGGLINECDGVIVGTALERGGRTGRPVDPERAREFVRVARRARRSR